MKRRQAGLSLLLLAACAHGPPPPSAPSPLLGKEAPSFRRPTVDGGRVDTGALRGRPVVIKFLARYCAPCVHSLPAVQRLHARHAGVAFLGIAEDEHEDDVRAQISNFGLSFPIVHDRDRVLAGRFRVTELPATFVVDAAGLVRWVGGPGQTEQGLERAIAAAR